MLRIKLVCAAPITALKAARFYFSLPRDIKSAIRSIKSDETVIDIGANIGVVTWLFAWRKCQIVAIEPHPIAYEKLANKFKSIRNVETINAAASVGDEKVLKLYLHKNYHENPMKYSLSSSITPDKPNLGEDYYNVTNINILKIFARYKIIRVLKIDIEGYEVDLLPYLLNYGELAKVNSIFVELHDKKWPSLSQKTRSMIEEFEKNQNHGKVFWNWP